MSTTKRTELIESFKNVFSALVIPIALIVSIIIFTKIMGDPSHFQGNDNKNEPIPGDMLGIVYRGGFIVPILMALLFTVITFAIERFFTIGRASGKSSGIKFVRKIKNLISSGDFPNAYKACDTQGGSIANVVNSALVKYEQIEKEQGMTKEQKILAIQKEVEEATALELPGLEQNLVILATISSIATLMGLLGTVLGMIRAFAAMANAGAPDSVALASGISEALINTAFGIGTAALAIIFYNFFTTKIDKITYSIDEAGFTIVQTYASKH
jgi:biopolymer transport protein ExbB